MKHQAPENANYAAVIIQVSTIIDLPNCDNVTATPALGYQAIVGKDTQVGDILVMFPAETQLSDRYTMVNNLFRHAEKNADVTKAGYIEDNRRVRAMKFRGHRSDALAMPLDSLASFLTPGDTLAVGDTFDTLNGHEICRKYTVKRSSQINAQSRLVAKAFKRVSEKMLPEHFDTAN